MLKFIVNDSSIICFQNGSEHCLLSFTSTSLRNILESPEVLMNPLNIKVCSLFHDGPG
jgi:hypothetical protein